MTPTAHDLYPVIDATWPAAALHQTGPWLVRDGQGGGKRVSAATAQAPVTGDDIDQAEQAQHSLNQPALFMIRETDSALDHLLAARGYALIDPVAIYLAPTAAIASPAPPPLAAIPFWPPLEITRLIWGEGGIGPERLAVMDRVTLPKTGLLGRNGSRSAGVAFVAALGHTAMLHALEVRPGQRRQGTALNIMSRAALWAQDQGATRISVLVTQANAPARNLYASLGMTIVGQYHYRQK